ncbi:E3 ubiquitin-protein ligase TRIM56-like [Saccostrea echinata]|uniref:E3 ubiquitin-protein ligase TRIM56-like n=1 Tax=Saccostrea echinata TaxID=191078 RepID=UPI002A82F3D1|nr:E3 ubiquitin-protein ligase TRIM56-like [Saccostrea echinata]
MESNAPVNLEELQKKFLECCICLELFNEEDRHPRLLPCLHTFCFKCLQALHIEGKITCPQCKLTHTLGENGLDCFRKDNTRRDLLDFVKASSNQKTLICGMCVENQKATHRCKQCEYFICKDCVEIHKKVVDMRSHDLIALQDLSDCSLDQLESFTHQSYCKDKNHGKKVLEMYCSSPTCQKPVCTICAFTTHNGHTISTIPEAFDSECIKLSEASVKVKNKISEIDKVMKLVEKETADLPEKTEEQKHTIQAIYANASEILRRKERDLCNEVTEKEQHKLEILELQCSELQELKKACVESCNFLKHSLRFGNNAAFLELWPTIEARMTELKSSTFDRKPRTNASSFKVLNAPNLLEFQNMANSLGKVVNSEAYFPNCNVSVPTTCSEGEEITFEVSLKTLTGSVINDEDVELIIERDLAEFARFKCTLADKTFICKWSPNTAASYCWYIISNGMEMRFQNNTIRVDAK